MVLYNYDYTYKINLFKHSEVTAIGKIAEAPGPVPRVAGLNLAQHEVEVTSLSATAMMVDNTSGFKLSALTFV
jgi:hypothetical protein